MKSYLLMVEHTPVGPHITMAPGMPREMATVLLAAIGQQWLTLDGATEGLATLLEDAAKLARENPGAFELVPDGDRRIIVPGRG